MKTKYRHKNKTRKKQKTTTKHKSAYMTIRGIFASVPGNESIEHLVYSDVGSAVAAVLGNLNEQTLRMNSNPGAVVNYEGELYSSVQTDELSVEITWAIYPVHPENGVRLGVAPTYLYAGVSPVYKRERKSNAPYLDPGWVIVQNY